MADGPEAGQAAGAASPQDDFSATRRVPGLKLSEEEMAKLGEKVGPTARDLITHLYPKMTGMQRKMFVEGILDGSVLDEPPSLIERLRKAFSLKMAVNPDKMTVIFWPVSEGRSAAMPCQLPALGDYLSLIPQEAMESWLDVVPSGGDGVPSGQPAPAASKSAVRTAKPAVQREGGSFVVLKGRAPPPPEPPKQQEAPPPPPRAKRQRTGDLSKTQVFRRVVDELSPERPRSAAAQTDPNDMAAALPRATKFISVAEDEYELLVAAAKDYLAAKRRRQGCLGWLRRLTRFMAWLVLVLAFVLAVGYVAIDWTLGQAKPRAQRVWQDRTVAAVASLFRPETAPVITATTSQPQPQVIVQRVEVPVRVPVIVTVPGPVREVERRVEVPAHERPVSDYRPSFIRDLPDFKLGVGGPVEVRRQPGDSRPVIYLRSERTDGGRDADLVIDTGEPPP